MAWPALDEPTFRNRAFEDVYNIGLVYYHLLVMIAGAAATIVGAVCVAAVHVLRKVDKLAPK